MTVITVGVIGLLPQAATAEAPATSRKVVAPDRPSEARQGVSDEARENAAEEVRAYRERKRRLADKRPRSLKYGCRYGPVERRISPEKLRELVFKHTDDGTALWEALQRVPDDPALDPIVITVPAESGPNCRIQSTGPKDSPEPPLESPEEARERAERLEDYLEMKRERADRSPRLVNQRCQWGPVERRITLAQFYQLVKAHEGKPGIETWAALQAIPDDPNLQPITVAVPGEEGPNCREWPPRGRESESESE